MALPRLKLLREQKGLKQSQLADAVDLAQTSIGNYERGDRFPDSEVIIRLCNYFKVSADYLLGLSDIPDRDVGSVATLPAEIQKDASSFLAAVAFLLSHESSVNYTRNLFTVCSGILCELVEIIKRADATFGELEKKYPGFNRSDPYGSAGATIYDLAAAAMSHEVKPELAAFLKDYHDAGAAIGEDLWKLASRAQQLLEVGACRALTGGFVPDKIKKEPPDVQELP